ncbi:MAG TPA: DUF438 domain-containing protein [Anaerolineae bacterium]|nr:DUF438 domain-containing protein [Anaerolineae bacterium]
MSKNIDNSAFRKAKLKELILKLHAGESQDSVKQELVQTLGTIPYGEVVEVEQELLEEGLPQEEVLKLCDIHSAVLEGNVDLSASKSIPEGHPVDVLIQENKALTAVIHEARAQLAALGKINGTELQPTVLDLIALFNQLIDVDKHYLRKEYLLFPYLEQTGVTGPPKVMWGKHDEIRDLLKGSLEVLRTQGITKEELLASTEIVLQPAVKGVADMIVKEEEILLPMLMDALSDADWYEIQKQSLEIGYCLYDPPTAWAPRDIEAATPDAVQQQEGRIQLPTGSFSVQDLQAILNTLPVDITFVGSDDKVKYFSQSSERIFQRNRAILNRDVRHCHPPASAHIVDKILEDFKSGRQNRAPFWINMRGRMIHIEYFALRDADGKYLGTLEVSQDLTGYRALEGEKRILSYA